MRWDRTGFRPPMCLPSMSISPMRESGNESTGHSVYSVCKFDTVNSTQAISTRIPLISALNVAPRTEWAPAESEQQLCCSKYLTASGIDWCRRWDTQAHRRSAAFGRLVVIRWSHPNTSLQYTTLLRKARQAPEFNLLSLWSNPWIGRNSWKAKHIWRNGQMAGIGELKLWRMGRTTWDTFSS